MTDWATKAFLPLGGWGLFAISFADSSFSPIPPDVLLIPLALASPRLALWYALLCTTASVLGAAFAYFVGERGGRKILLRVVPEEKIAWVERVFERWGAWAVGVAGFVPMPLYKEFTLSAGLFKLDKAGFILASILGRGGRFFLLAVLLGAYGPAVVLSVSHNLVQVTLATILAVAAGYWLFRVRLAGVVRAFVNRRLEIWGEYVVYFTAGWVLLSLSTAVFGKLVDELFVEKGPVPEDFLIIRWLHHLQSPGLTAFMTGVTNLGSLWVITVLAVSAVLCFALRRRHVDALLVAVLTAGSGGLIQSVKTLLRRARPTVIPHLVAASGYSFPSGHSLAALSFYGLLVYLLLRHRPGRWNKPAAAGLAVIIGLVGVSRIYLGVHWPTDVLGAWAVGGTWLLTCILVSEELRLKLIRTPEGR